MGDPLPDLDALVDLVENGVAPRTKVSARRRTRKRAVRAARE
jgi:hypothetical protein